MANPAENGGYGYYERDVDGDLQAGGAMHRQWWMALALALIGHPGVAAAQEAVEAAEADASVRIGEILTSAGYGSAPLEVLPTGHFAIRGQVGEEGLELIVDTGASHTVIDAARAERFGLLSEDRGGRVTGVGATSQSVESGTLHDVRIGPLSMERMRVSVMDLSAVNSVLERLGSPAVDGIVGADVLIRRNAIIDYGALRVYFRD